MVGPWGHSLQLMYILLSCIDIAYCCMVGRPALLLFAITELLLLTHYICSFAISICICTVLDLEETLALIYRHPTHGPIPNSVPGNTSDSTVQPIHTSVNPTVWGILGWVQSLCIISWIATEELFARYTNVYVLLMVLRHSVIGLWIYAAPQIWWVTIAHKWTMYVGV